MKVENYLTKEMIDFRDSARTEDQCYLHSNDASKFCDILKKGVISTEDVDEVIAVHKEMYDTRTKLLLCLKRESKKNGKSGNYLINLTKGREDELALEHFKKTRSCLTEREHIKIMNLIISEQTDYPGVFIKRGENSFPKGDYSDGLKFKEYYTFLDKILIDLRGEDDE